jgi:drug/metabolite transporter (DMT)-like permease
MSSSQRRTIAIVALSVTTLIWAAPPLFQKYLLPSFGNAGQNFYRYLIGFFVSVPFIVTKLRERKFRLHWHHLSLMLLPAIPNVLHQYAGVASLEYLMPGFVSLFGKVGILFSFGLSYWMFRDERWLFRSGPFLAGFLLAFGGSIGLALLKPGTVDAARFYKGILWIVACGPLWAFYSVMIKKTTEKLGVGISFSLISLWTSIGFLPLAAWEGRLDAIVDAPWPAITTLVVSAVLAIGLAHPLYYYSVRSLGVSVCQVVLLATPIPTILASAWLFREVLTVWQTLFGTVLIVGGAMACLARRPSAIDPAREIATSRDV